MNLKRTSVLLLATAVLLALVAAACQPAGPAPTTVVRDYYEALNSENIDAAMGYIAPDAAFVNPTGTYEGADAIRASLKSRATEDFSFNLSNLRDTNGAWATTTRC
jgi:ketosteroid isomerase-like protein